MSAFHPLQTSSVSPLAAQRWSVEAAQLNGASCRKRTLSNLPRQPFPVSNCPALVGEFVINDLQLPTADFAILAR